MQKSFANKYKLSRLFKYFKETPCVDNMPSLKTGTSGKHFVSAIEGVKSIYHTKIQPFEEAYSFDKFSSPCLTDLDAAPMVLLLGQYSTGKTSLVEYLLGRPYLGTNFN